MAIRSNSKRHLGSAQPTQEQNEENKISKEGKTLNSLMTFYWLLTEPLYIDRNEEFGQKRKSPPGPWNFSPYPPTHKIKLISVHHSQFWE